MNKPTHHGALIEVREALEWMQSNNVLYGVYAHHVARHSLEKLDALIEIAPHKDDKGSIDKSYKILHEALQESKDA